MEKLPGKKEKESLVYVCKVFGLKQVHN
jgi:hypothetical protein